MTQTKSAVDLSFERSYNLSRPHNGLLKTADTITGPRRLEYDLPVLTSGGVDWTPIISTGHMMRTLKTVSPFSRFEPETLVRIIH